MHSSTSSSTRARLRALEHEHDVGRQSVRAVSRILNNMRNPSGICKCGFAWAWMALRARNAPPWLLANFRDFEPPEHVTRISARAHTCALVFGRAPCVPRSREHGKRLAAGREKNADVQKKTHLHVVIYEYDCCSQEELRGGSPHTAHGYWTDCFG